MKFKEFLEEEKKPEVKGDVVRKWLKQRVRFGNGKQLSFPKACRVYEDGTIELNGGEGVRTMWIDGDMKADGKLLSIENGPIKFSKAFANCELKSVYYHYLSKVEPDDIIDTVELLGFNTSDIPQISKFASRMTKLTNFQIFNCKKIPGVLALLKIPTLEEINFAIVGPDMDKLRKLTEIMMRHLKGERDIPECQQELIEEGLEEYAKL